MPLIRDNRRTDRRDSRQDDRQVCDCRRIWSIDLCLILILGRSYWWSWRSPRRQNWRSWWSTRRSLWQPRRCTGSSRRSIRQSRWPTRWKIRQSWKSSWPKKINSFLHYQNLTVSINKNFILMKINFKYTGVSSLVHYLLCHVTAYAFRRKFGPLTVSPKKVSELYTRLFPSNTYISSEWTLT